MNDSHQQCDYFDRNPLHAVLNPTLLQAPVEAVYRVPRG